MPLILPGNVATATASTGYNVANSLKFEGADSLQRSKGTQTSLQKGTYSFWIKRTDIDGTQHFVYSNSVDASNKGYYSLRADEKFRIVSDASSGELVLETSQLLRDPTAWMHIVIRIDTTQGTAANRCIFYINGVAVTALDTTTYPDQNANLKIFEGGETDKEFIGGMTGETSNLHCYLAEFVFCDGQSLGPTSFGEFDEDSPTIWKPIDVSGLTFGNQGWYLDFEDSSALGNSSNSNNFGTVNNLAATDQATDTCTNNFCTMNPLVPTTNITFSEGNCKMVVSSSGAQGGGIGTFGLTAGKWYWEVKIASTVGNHNHGTISENTSELYQNAAGLQNDTGVTCWRNDDGGEVVVDGSASSNDYGIMADGSIMGIALDMDNYNITYLDDGSALVSDFNMSTTRGTIFPMIHTGASTTSEVNFGGCPSFTVSSAASDANGYGNFEHAPPSGYLALCSKNLGSTGG